MNSSSTIDNFPGHLPQTGNAQVPVVGAPGNCRMGGGELTGESTPVASGQVQLGHPQFTNVRPPGWSPGISFHPNTTGPPQRYGATTPALLPAQGQHVVSDQGNPIQLSASGDQIRADSSSGWGPANALYGNQDRSERTGPYHSQPRGERPPPGYPASRSTQYYQQSRDRNVGFRGEGMYLQQQEWQGAPHVGPPQDAIGGEMSTGWPHLAQQPTAPPKLPPIGMALGQTAISGPTTAVRQGGAPMVHAGIGTAPSPHVQPPSMPGLGGPPGTLVHPPGLAAPPGLGGVGVAGPTAASTLGAPGSPELFKQYFASGTSLIYSVQMRHPDASKPYVDWITFGGEEALLIHHILILPKGAAVFDVVGETEPSNIHSFGLEVWQRQIANLTLDHNKKTLTSPCFIKLESQPGTIPGSIVLLCHPIIDSDGKRRPALILSDRVHIRGTFKQMTVCFFGLRYPVERFPPAKRNLELVRNRLREKPVMPDVPSQVAELGENAEERSDLAEAPLSYDWAAVNPSVVGRSLTTVSSRDEDDLRKWSSITAVDGIDALAERIVAEAGRNTRVSDCPDDAVWKGSGDTHQEESHPDGQSCIATLRANLMALLEEIRPSLEQLSSTEHRDYSSGSEAGNHQLQIPDVGRFRCITAVVSLMLAHHATLTGEADNVGRFSFPLCEEELSTLVTVAMLPLEVAEFPQEKKHVSASCLELLLLLVRDKRTLPAVTQCLSLRRLVLLSQGCQEGEGSQLPREPALNSLLAAFLSNGEVPKGYTILRRPLPMRTQLQCFQIVLVWLEHPDAMEVFLSRTPIEASTDLAVMNSSSVKNKTSPTDSGSDLPLDADTDRLESGDSKTTTNTTTRTQYSTYELLMLMLRLTRAKSPTRGEGLRGVRLQFFLALQRRVTIYVACKKLTELSDPLSHAEEIGVEVLLRIVSAALDGVLEVKPNLRIGNKTGGDSHDMTETLTRSRAPDNGGNRETAEVDMWDLDRSMRALGIPHLDDRPSISPPVTAEMASDSSTTRAIGKKESLRAGHQDPPLVAAVTRGSPVVCCQCANDSGANKTISRSQERRWMQDVVGGEVLPFALRFLVSLGTCCSLQRIVSSGKLSRDPSIMILRFLVSVAATFPLPLRKTLLPDADVPDIKDDALDNVDCGLSVTAVKQLLKSSSPSGLQQCTDVTLLRTGFAVLIHGPQTLSRAALAGASGKVPEDAYALVRYLNAEGLHTQGTFHPKTDGDRCRSSYLNGGKMSGGSHQEESGMKAPNGVPPGLTGSAAVHAGPTDVFALSAYPWASQLLCLGMSGYPLRILALEATHLLRLSAFELETRGNVFAPSFLLLERILSIFRALLIGFVTRENVITLKSDFLLTMIAGRGGSSKELRQLHEQTSRLLKILEEYEERGVDAEDTATRRGFVTIPYRSPSGLLQSLVPNSRLPLRRFGETAKNICICLSDVGSFLELLLCEPSSGATDCDGIIVPVSARRVIGALRIFGEGQPILPPLIDHLEEDNQDIKLTNQSGSGRSTIICASQDPTSGHILRLSEVVWPAPGIREETKRRMKDTQNLRLLYSLTLLRNVVERYTRDPFSSAFDAQQARTKRDTTRTDDPSDTQIPYVASLPDIHTSLSGWLLLPNPWKTQEVASSILTDPSSVTDASARTIGMQVDECMQDLVPSWKYHPTVGEVSESITMTLLQSRKIIEGLLLATCDQLGSFASARADSVRSIIDDPEMRCYFLVLLKTLQLVRSSLRVLFSVGQDSEGGFLSSCRMFITGREGAFPTPEQAETVSALYCYVSTKHLDLLLHMTRQITPIVSYLRDEGAQGFIPDLVAATWHEVVALHVETIAMFPSALPGILRRTLLVGNSLPDCRLPVVELLTFLLRSSPDEAVMLLPPADSRLWRVFRSNTSPPTLPPYLSTVPERRLAESLRNGALSLQLTAPLSQEWDTETSQGPSGAVTTAETLSSLPQATSKLDTRATGIQWADKAEAWGTPLESLVFLSLEIFLLTPAEAEYEKQRRSVIRKSKTRRTWRRCDETSCGSEILGCLSLETGDRHSLLGTSVFMPDAKRRCLWVPTKGVLPSAAMPGRPAPPPAQGDAAVGLRGYLRLPRPTEAWEELRFVESVIRGVWTTEDSGAEGTKPLTMAAGTDADEKDLQADPEHFAVVVRRFLGVLRMEQALRIEDFSLLLSLGSRLLLSDVSGLSSAAADLLEICFQVFDMPVVEAILSLADKQLERRFTWNLEDALDIELLGGNEQDMIQRWSESIALLKTNFRNEAREFRRISSCLAVVSRIFHKQLFRIPSKWHSNACDRDAAAMHAEESHASQAGDVKCCTADLFLKVVGDMVVPVPAHTPNGRGIVGGHRVSGETTSAVRSLYESRQRVLRSSWMTSLQTILPVVASCLATLQRQVTHLEKLVGAELLSSEEDLLSLMVDVTLPEIHRIRAILMNMSRLALLAFLHLGLDEGRPTVPIPPFPLGAARGSVGYSAQPKPNSLRVMRFIVSLAVAELNADPHALSRKWKSCRYEARSLVRDLVSCFRLPLLIGVFSLNDFACEDLALFMRFISLRPRTPHAFKSLPVEFDSIWSFEGLLSFVGQYLPEAAEEGRMDRVESLAADLETALVTVEAIHTVLQQAAYDVVLRWRWEVPPSLSDEINRWQKKAAAAGNQALREVADLYGDLMGDEAPSTGYVSERGYTQREDEKDKRDKTNACDATKQRSHSISHFVDTLSSSLHSAIAHLLAVANSDVASERHTTPLTLVNKLQTLEEQLDRMQTLLERVLSGDETLGPLPVMLMPPALTGRGDPPLASTTSSAQPLVSLQNNPSVSPASFNPPPPPPMSPVLGGPSVASPEMPVLASAENNEEVAVSEYSAASRKNESAYGNAYGKTAVDGEELVSPIGGDGSTSFPRVEHLPQTLQADEIRHDTVQEAFKLTPTEDEENLSEGGSSDHWLLSDPFLSNESFGNTTSGNMEEAPTTLEDDGDDLFFYGGDTDTKDEKT